MTRDDVVELERYYATVLRRESNKRRMTNEAAALQLERFAIMAERRVEALLCGPLFDETKR